jgi:hypothetical protein
MPMSRSFCFVLGTLSISLYLSLSAQSAEPGVDTASKAGKVEVSAKQKEAPQCKGWKTDYASAMGQAAKESKMLFVYFAMPNDAQCAWFETEVFTDSFVCERLRGMVCVKLPMDAKVTVEGSSKPIELLQHPSFAEMLGLPGIAIIDMASKKANYYGTVVSVFPFFAQRPYQMEDARTMVDLPPGTITQRTMIFAVRIHPERPASVRGQLNTMLLTEAESHSAYQAAINRQGHHFWESRFPRISALLPGGQLPREVCAESWPGEGLLQAAIECVRCWRTSSGHWSAVSGQQQSYGYDMKRGSNGIWYATGIFGR